MFLCFFTIGVDRFSFFYYYKNYQSKAPPLKRKKLKKMNANINTSNDNTFAIDVKGVNDFMALTYSLELNPNVLNSAKMKARYERKVINSANSYIAETLLSYNRIIGLIDEAINGNRNWDSVRHAVFVAFENSNRAKVNIYTHNQYVEVINRYGDKPYIKNPDYIFVV